MGTKHERWEQDMNKQHLKSMRTFTADTYTYIHTYTMAG